jgi:hypothetical protein
MWLSACGTVWDIFNTSLLFPSVTSATANSGGLQLLAG